MEGNLFLLSKLLKSKLFLNRLWCLLIHFFTVLKNYYYVCALNI